MGKKLEKAYNPVSVHHVRFFFFFGLGSVLMVHPTGALFTLLFFPSV